MNTNRKLVKMDSVEGEVLVVNGVEGPAHDAGLDLVLLLWQQLQFNVGIAGNKKQIVTSLLDTARV